MTPTKENILEELKNFTTLNLIANTSSILEKIFWASIAILGTLFIYNVVFVQLQNWEDNPTLITTEMKRLSNMPLPSVTFCHKGLEKYGVVEQLANYIDPEKQVPKEVVAIRNEFLKLQIRKRSKDLDGTDFCTWLFKLKGDERDDNMILGGINPSQLDMYKSICDVSISI